MAEAAGLHAVAADLHRAPGARAVARLVVEGDAAVLVAAGLQALPVVGRRELRHRRDDAAECPAGSVVLGSEDGAAAVETDTEVRLPTRLLERLRSGGGVDLDAVVCKEQLPDRLPDGVGVLDLLPGRLDQIVHESLLREPHRELVRRRYLIDARFEIERVDEVSDEIQLAM